MDTATLTAIVAGRLRELSDTVLVGLVPDDKLVALLSAAPAAAPRAAREPRTPTPAATGLDDAILGQLAGSAKAFGELHRAVDATPAQVQRRLRALKEAGRIFQGGDRRFARYALAQFDADTASRAARG